MDSMISSAARAKSELVEAKQQVNVLEAHSRRFASERESLYSQIESLKVSLYSRILTSLTPAGAEGTPAGFS